MRTQYLFKQKTENCCMRLIKQKLLKINVLSLFEELHLFPEHAKQAAIFIVQTYYFSKNIPI